MPDEREPRPGLRTADVCCNCAKSRAVHGWLFCDEGNDASTVDAVQSCHAHEPREEAKP